MKKGDGAGKGVLHVQCSAFSVQNPESRTNDDLRMTQTSERKTSRSEPRTLNSEPLNARSALNP